MKLTDCLLQERILQAKENSINWLNSMSVAGMTPGVLRVS